ncbi:MAG TPA: hypothetical protein VFZ40_00160 [Pyrinomonadaceae bacterium]
MKRLLFAIGVGLLLTVVFFLIGAFFSGGGHSLTAMMIFFPYSGLVASWLENTRGQFIATVLMAVQFPAYALLVAYTKGTRRNVVSTIVPIIHTVVAVIALQIYESSKPRYGVLLPMTAIQQIVGRERRVGTGIGSDPIQTQLA